MLVVLNVVVIWGQSLMPRFVSSAESGFFQQLLTPLFEIFVGQGNVTEHLVRKFAHFAEFFSLGVLSTLLLVLRKGRISATVICAPVFCVFVAIVDEALQFITDRSPEIADVLLDTLGTLFGFAITLIILLIIQAITKD